MVNILVSPGEYRDMDNDVVTLVISANKSKKKPGVIIVIHVVILVNINKG